MPELKPRQVGGVLARGVPRSRMRAIPMLILWCCSAPMSCLWTADLRAGPWQAVAPDGSIVIGTRWAAAADERIRGSLLGIGEERPLALERIPGGVLLTVRLPPTSAGLTATLTVGSVRLKVPIAAVPAPGAAGAVVMLGPGQSLTPGFIASVQAAAGTAPVAVVLAGGDRIERLESSTAPWPYLLLGDGPDLAGLAQRAPGALHHAIATWGALGLPIATTMTEWPRALARDLSAWTVPVVPDAPWDPSVFADPGRASSASCRDLIGLFAGLGHTAAVLIGTRTGFVSEPLGLESAGIVVRSGGVRLIGATPLGDGLAGLDDHLAAGLDGIGIAVIAADAQQMTITLASATARMPVQWRRSERPAGGWGGGDVEASWHAFIADPTTINGNLAWALPRSFDAITPASSQRDVLVTAAATNDLARITARRLLIRMDASLVGEEPDWLRRERILRDLGSRTVRPGSPAFLALPTTTDLHLIHAAIRCATGRARGPILDALQRRLTLQAEGSVPFAANPLDQHRLVSAVFDASDRSPTPLRPLARALLDKLDPLSRGPVQRFIALSGEFRSP